jgi:serine phosphatase RsbU (regulator of sigma subunit)/Tfp pilus assembly protein PilF
MILYLPAMQFIEKKILRVLFLLVLSVFSAAAQNTAVDSLGKLLINTKEDTAKVNLLKSVALEYRNSDPAKFAEYLNKSYALAVKINYKKGIANGLFSLGALAQKKENFEKALSLFSSSMELAKELKDTMLVANCLNNMGNIYLHKGAYEKANELYLKSLALREAIKDITGIGISYNNIGNFHTHKGEYEQSLKNYFKSLDAYERSNSNDRIPITLMNIGSIYTFQKDYLKAIDYYRKSLKTSSNPITIAMLYNNIGAAYTQIKMFDKADENLITSLKLSEANANKTGIANTLANMGINLMSGGKFDKAMDYYFKALKIAEELGDKKFISDVINNISLAYEGKKDFKKALEYGEKGLLLAKEIGAKEIIKNSYESLSETYKKLGNYEKSLEYYKLSVALKDSMFSKEKIQSIAELNTRYETDKKEKEIQLLTKDNELKEKEFKEQKIIRFSLSGGLVLLFILSFTLHNRYRFKQKANLLLEDQKKQIELKNIQITDSIDYAKTIQEAILPSDKSMHAFFPHSFILYKPKDIVSGDFYWAGEKDDKLICVAADCTGHGVPGAFMSLLGNNILENVIRKAPGTAPASILNVLNEEILNALAKDGERKAVKNGMDIALITLDKGSRQLQYAGAHHPLYLIRDGELLEIKADRASIGSSGETPVEFTDHTMEFKKNDLIYLFSDGFPDQIGGQGRKKFYYQPFKDLLLSIHKLEMNEQKESLDKAITAWKGRHEQTDDVLVMGIRC